MEPEDKADETRQIYHRHLDDCERCRTRCFDPCPEGARLLLLAAREATSFMTRLEMP
jgi:hypothetical protein